MGLKHYNPKLVDLIVGGFPVSGFAENSMITFDEDDDRFKSVGGVDGDVTRSQNLIFLGTLTVHLMSSSKANDFFSALHQTDINADGGAGVVPGLIRDKNGTSLNAMPRIWVVKPPQEEFTDKASPRDWKFAAEGFKRFVGGT
jgi:hypothetical protein